MKFENEAERCQSLRSRWCCIDFSSVAHSVNDHPSGHVVAEVKDNGTKLNDDDNNHEAMRADDVLVIHRVHDGYVDFDSERDEDVLRCDVAQPQWRVSVPYRARQPTSHFLS